MSTVRLHLIAEAEEDANEATTFYRRLSPAVAAAFRADLRRVLAPLRERPHSGAPNRHGTRRRHFSDYPYSVIYLLEGDDLRVVAIVHDRRDPEHWRARLPGR